MPHADVNELARLASRPSTVLKGDIFSGISRGPSRNNFGLLRRVFHYPPRRYTDFIAFITRYLLLKFHAHNVTLMFIFHPFFRSLT